MKGRWFVVAVALMAGAGCSNATAPPPAKLHAIAVPCVIPDGVPLSDGGKTFLAHSYQGPLVCGRALELFLREDPYKRIVSILPLEYPVERDQPGTQELIVIYSRGPGPGWLADELDTTRIAITPCGLPDDGVGGEWEPRKCVEGLLDSFEITDPETVFWIPLTSYDSVGEPGTNQVLRVLRHARSTSR